MDRLAKKSRSGHLQLRLVDVGLHPEVVAEAELKTHDRGGDGFQVVVRNVLLEGECLRDFRGKQNLEVGLVRVVGGVVVEGRRFPVLHQLVEQKVRSGRAVEKQVEVFSGPGKISMPVKNVRTVKAEPGCCNQPRTFYSCEIDPNFYLLWIDLELYSCTVQDADLFIIQQLVVVLVAGHFKKRAWIGLH